MPLSRKVWTKFSVKKKDGSVLNLRTMNMPKYLKDEVLKLYISYFVKEETIFKASGVPKNPHALAEIYGLLAKAANEDEFHIVVCSLDKDFVGIKDIVGVSMMALVSTDDPEPQYDFRTEEMKKLFEIVHILEASYNEMKALDLDRCFSDRGVFVCPQYRGLGIAQVLLNVRRLICKDYGIPINGAWMTSYGTQKAAERDGWETVFEFQYEEFGKTHGLAFTNEPPSSKFMIARIE